MGAMEGYICRPMTKIHHKAQPPHEVNTSFHCSNQVILPSLFTCRNPLKLPQKCQITSLQPLFSGNTPSSRFHNAGTTGQKHHKNVNNNLAYGKILIKSPPWASIMGLRELQRPLSGTPQLLGLRVVLLLVTS